MAQHGTAAVVVPPPQGPGHAPHDSGLSVASSTKEEDLARIRDLEEEVRYLADRANQASQKFADYENEIRTLEAKLRQEQKRNAASGTGGGGEGEKAAAVVQQQQQPQLSRFGSLMRKPSYNTQPNGAVPAAAAAAPASASREKELEEKIVKEQTARIAAEKKVREVNAEIEDLSTTLFQQANEMVAAERKENAALAEKIRVLERRQGENEAQVRVQEEGGKKAVRLEAENVKLKARVEVLEKREGERKARLERLERAGERIERVKGLLGQG